MRNVGSVAAFAISEIRSGNASKRSLAPPARGIVSRSAVLRGRPAALCARRFGADFARRAPRTFCRSRRCVHMHAQALACDGRADAAFLVRLDATAAAVVVAPHASGRVGTCRFIELCAVLDAHEGEKLGCVHAAPARCRVFDPVAARCAITRTLREKLRT